jgi:LysR family tcuABC transcriptional regulator
MELRQLRYFVAIVECGSLVKASKQIYVAQPALSQQLAKLEHEIGKPLLHRSARGVTATTSGLALYKHAKFLLRHVEQAIHAAREEGEATGMVSLGISPTTSRVLGLPLLMDIRARYPGIVLNVVESLSGHLHGMVRAGTLDIAILFESNPALGMSVEPLIAEELVLILGAGGPALPAGKETITIAEMALLPMILATGGHRTRRLLESEFERLALKLNLVAEIDSMPLTMAAVRQGLGATIQARSTLLGQDPGDYRVLRIDGAGLTRHCYLYGPAPEKQFPAASAVLEAIRAMAARMIADGTWVGTALPER